VTLIPENWQNKCHHPLKNWVKKWVKMLKNRLKMAKNGVFYVVLLFFLLKTFLYYYNFAR
jgi:hypothetical protein